MIQANELRIGNWVLKDDTYRKVEAISIPYHHLLSLRNKVLLEECQFNEIQPIPLTEEILLKCGFEKDGVPAGFTIIDKFQIRYCYKDIIKNTWQWSFEAFDDDNWIGISKPQYLHQLQNLYFPLTGEELEINL